MKKFNFFIRRSEKKYESAKLKKEMNELMRNIQHSKEIVNVISDMKNIGGIRPSVEIPFSMLF